MEEVVKADLLLDAAALVQRSHGAHLEAELDGRGTSPRRDGRVRCVFNRGRVQAVEVPASLTTSLWVARGSATGPEHARVDVLGQVPRRPAFHRMRCSARSARSGDVPDRPAKVQGTGGKGGDLSERLDTIIPGSGTCRRSRDSCGRCRCRPTLRALHQVDGAVDARVIRLVVEEASLRVDVADLRVDA
jgi:hypothetical protein